MSACPGFGEFEGKLCGIMTLNYLNLLQFDLKVVIVVMLSSCFYPFFPLQLMDKECYRDIEKIKTIGSTYMAAVGLVPTTASKVHMQ